MTVYRFEQDTGPITQWGATQAADILLRETMGWLPTVSADRTREWTPQYAVAVARMMHSVQNGAALLIEFGFPLSVALAVLTGRKLDLII